MVISQLTTNTWYHLVAVQRSGEVEYYINGTSVGTYTNASSYNASGSNEFRVGAASNSNLYASGLIDHVLVYDRALSSADVDALAAGEAVSGASVPEFPMWFFIPIFFCTFLYTYHRFLVV
ncbi:LamG domain-containing protein [Candidatus Nomurabacteria bacterium]|nr:LamG domain-containing protein [Candidatus Nomurabacteria bacterium]